MNEAFARLKTGIVRAMIWPALVVPLMFLFLAFDEACFVLLCYVRALVLLSIFAFLVMECQQILKTKKKLTTMNSVAVFTFLVLVALGNLMFISLLLS